MQSGPWGLDLILVRSGYKIEDTLGSRIRLKIITNEFELEVVISNDLKPNDQVCKAAFTVSRVMGVLTNTFLSRDVGL